MRVHRFRHNFQTAVVIFMIALKVRKWGRVFTTPPEMTPMTYLNGINELYVFVKRHTEGKVENTLRVFYTFENCTCIIHA